MGVAVANLKDFERKFAKRKDRSDLFGFFLFDERPSQRAVEAFAEQQFPWLDRLAAAAQMFFFVFLRNNPDWPEVVENPGLEVANTFGIRANELPGIVFFTLDSKREDVRKAAYLPLKTELFEADLERIEKLFADVFSVVQECRATSQDAGALLECVEKEVNRIIRSESRRPVKEYLGEVMVGLRHLPGKFLETVTTALVDGALRQGMPLG